MLLSSSFGWCCFPLSLVGLLSCWFFCVFLSAKCLTTTGKGGWRKQHHPKEEEEGSTTEEVVEEAAPLLNPPPSLFPHPTHKGGSWGCKVSWNEVKALPLDPWFSGMRSLELLDTSVVSWPRGFAWMPIFAMIPKADGDSTPLGHRPPNPKKEGQPQPKGPTPTRRANTCLFFSLHHHTYKNMDFICIYLVLPQKAGQPQPQEREGPTPT